MGLESSQHEQSARTTAPKRRSSVRRVYAAAIGLVAVTIVALAIVDIVSSDRQIKDAWVKSQTDLARVSANEVGEFLSEVEALIQGLAGGAVAVGVDPTFSRWALLNLLRTSPSIMAASIADRDGRELARVARDQFVDEDDFRDLSATIAYQNAIAGHAYYSRPYFERNSEPYMTIAEPIDDARGVPQGLVMVELSLRDLSALTGDLSARDASTRYVISEDGDLLAHPDLSLVLARPDLASVGSVERALAGTEIDATPQRGLGSDLITMAYNRLPITNWLVVVEQPIETLKSLLWQARARILILLGISLIALAIGAGWIYRRFVGPVRRMSAVADEMRAGNFTVNAEPGSGDEYASIAGALNHMSSRLGGFQTLLADEVRRRTREITEALQAAISYDSIRDERSKPIGRVEGSAAEAALLLRRALDKGTLSDPSLTIVMQAALCEALIQAGKPDEAREVFDSAIEESGPLGPSAQLPLLQAMMSAKAYAGLLDVRLSAGRRAVDILSRDTIEAANADLLSLHFEDLIEAGDLSAAKALIDLVSRAQAEDGDGAMKPIVMRMRVLLGLSRTVSQDIQDQIETLHADGVRAGNSDAAEHYAREMALVRRELSIDSTSVEALKELRDVEPDIYVWGPIWAVTQSHRGNLNDARVIFEQLAAVGFETIPRDARRSVSLAELAETAVLLNDVSRARALYELLLPYAGRNIVGATVCLGPADRILGALAAVLDDLDAAERHFEEAISFSREQPLWNARAKLGLARFLLRQHQNDRGTELLQETLERAKSLGLTKLREECLALLSREPAAGPLADGLTPAELRVFRLITSGATNRSISEKLHLSPYTVANHVSSILSKTGSRNRTEAANYARQHGLISEESSE